MKDVAGRELKEGQTVAYAGQGREGKTASLRLAKVTGRFTPKMVEIAVTSRWDAHGFPPTSSTYLALKSPGDLAIVKDPPPVGEIIEP